ncbi:MAG: SDR family oxidoreductase [Flavobacteriaceae bacterium]|nr:SDR family oxidoreductase [Flavobacteriaceae bacterium]
MKYALITGVSSGIGKSTAIKFLQQGFYVFGSVRKPGDAAGLQQEFSELFHELVFDISDHNAVDAGFAIIENIVGQNRLDVFVNNAGVAKYGPIQHVLIDELRQQFEVNVFSNVYITQKALPLLGADYASKKKGKIVVISSTGGVMTRPMLGPYSASKHAVEAIYDALRREMMLFGIDVIIIQPGPIKTDIWNKAKRAENPYAGTAYEEIFDKLDDAVEQIEKIGLPASAVADKIWDACQSAKPKDRYIITPKKLAFYMAMYILPAKTLDKIFFKDLKKLNK